MMSSNKKVVTHESKAKSGQKTLPPAITELLNDYQNGLTALGRSAKTIKSYFEILPRYFWFLETRNMLKSITALGRGELHAYLLQLQTASRWPNRRPGPVSPGHLSPYTIQDHIRAIKAFWGWLVREGYIDKNPLEKFPLPKVPRIIMEIITPEIFSRLLTLIDRSTPLGVQRYCLMLALYDGGERISEILGALTANIDFNQGFIRVMGKGNKERDVPMSRLTLREIRHYLRDFRSIICSVESPYLFPGPDGQPLSVNTIQQFMRRLAKKTGIDNLKLHPHLLRHAFGTQFIVNGGNVFYLKEIMGHSSLATTLKYTHLRSEDLRREHAKFSPLCNLSLGQGAIKPHYHYKEEVNHAWLQKESARGK